jgi:hypothetical protein
MPTGNAMPGAPERVQPSVSMSHQWLISVMDVLRHPPCHTDHASSDTFASIEDAWAPNLTDQ